jgi:hypothetical protein
MDATKMVPVFVFAKISRKVDGQKTLFFVLCAYFSMRL